jgi:hypothetical protein
MMPRLHRHCEGMTLNGEEAERSLMGHFSVIGDPLKRRHKLIDIVIIAIAAVICGADGWVAVAASGRAKERWLRRFLDLPHGIPSHDTLGRVFYLLDPKVLEACFRDGVASIRHVLPDEIVWPSTARACPARTTAVRASGRRIWSAPGRSPTRWCSGRSRRRLNPMRSRRFRACWTPCFSQG